MILTVKEEQGKWVIEGRLGSRSQRVTTDRQPDEFDLEAYKRLMEEDFMLWECSSASS